MTSGSLANSRSSTRRRMSNQDTEKNTEICKCSCWEWRKNYFRKVYHNPYPFVLKYSFSFAPIQVYGDSLADNFTEADAVDAPVSPYVTFTHKWWYYWSAPTFFLFFRVFNRVYSLHVWHKYSLFLSFLLAVVIILLGSNSFCNALFYFFCPLLHIDSKHSQVRGHEKDVRALCPHLHPFVRGAYHWPAFFYGLRPPRPARHGPVQGTARHSWWGW